jgi:hypothetical protein
MPSVAFLIRAVADLNRGGIGFTAIADDASIACFISQEVLRDDFGASGIDGASLMEAFHAKHSRIRSTVEDKIADGAFEPDGSVLLQAADFWM